MSFVMGALARYRAVAGLHNATFAGQQNNQARMALANGAGSSSNTAALASADKSLAMKQATTGFMAQACDVQLDSMEAANKKRVGENFNYFA